MVWRVVLHALAVALAVTEAADLEAVALREQGGRAVVSVLDCCDTPPPGPIEPGDWAPDPRTSTVWMPVVDRAGRPYPEGHANDVYYTGKRPRKAGRRPPASYRYAPGAPLSVHLAKRFPGARHVAFTQFPADFTGTLTPRGEARVEATLRRIYGADAVIRKLGEGGFQVVFLVRPRGRPGRVAKIRKTTPTVLPARRLETLASAAWDLRRDLAMQMVAEQVIARGRYVDEAGRPAPFLIDGRPARPPGPPRAHLARVAPVTDESLLERGIVEQELVRFAASEALEAYLARDRDKDKNKPGGWRKRALAMARETTEVSAREVASFLDRFCKPSRFGPDVIKVRAWFDACSKLRVLPPIARLCRLARRSYRIPDDFADRLRALEQLYRDTAGDVIPFHRLNFIDASGNDAADGKVREVGLDFNHGHNAGWDPHTGQFVLFDW